jgi:hypothetical protein
MYTGILYAGICRMMCVARIPYSAAMGIALCISLSVSTIFAFANPLEAQIRFATPDTPINLSKYRTFDDCLALKRRLNAREKRRLPYWKDSLEYGNSEKLKTQPAPVRDTLTLCMAKLSPANVDYSNYTEYLDWITVLYDIGRADDAHVIIDKKLSMTKWDKNDTAGRHKIITALLGPLELARPMPWDVYVRVAKMIDSPDASSPWETRMNVYRFLFLRGEDIHDTTVQRYAADKAVELEKTLSDEDKAGYSWQTNGRYTVLLAMDFLHQNEMLDSLRVGPKSYLSFRHSYWNKIRGQNSDKLPNHVGATAKPVFADFWFKREGDSVVRLSQAPGTIPEEGGINLIVFLEIRCADNTPTFTDPYHRSFPMSGSCLPSYSVIRRLAERYPSLRVTIVSLTDGFIGLTAPMNPTEEAVHKSQWWLNTFRLPATLAVAEQKFFRLPEPDGRRIDESHQNTTNYLFGTGNTRVPAGTAFLVDIDGTVLYSSEIGPRTERQFNQLLNVIVHRIP